MSRDGQRRGPAPQPAGGRRRAPYRRPRLERLGDIRGLTLGASPGIDDSGLGSPEMPQP